MAPSPIAANYDDRTLIAVVSVLLELRLILGEYQDAYVVIGGSVPWLLHQDAETPHIGTMDVDLGLNPDALAENRYVDFVHALEAAGYIRSEALRVFQMQRTVDVAGGPPVKIIVDFLMPREAVLCKNKPPLVANFAVQKASGAGVAIEHFVEVELAGRLPDGRSITQTIRVAATEAMLVMKGYALTGRDKLKDAYDIYYLVRSFDGGPAALAEVCRPLLKVDTALEGFQKIAQHFKHENDFGPATVCRFLSESDLMDGMTDDQLKLDAYQQVAAWLRELGPFPNSSL